MPSFLSGCWIFKLGTHWALSPTPSLISVSRNRSSWILHCRLEATFQEFQHVPDLASVLSSPDCLLLSFKSSTLNGLCLYHGTPLTIVECEGSSSWLMWLDLKSSGRSTSECSPWEGETHAGGIIPWSDVPDRIKSRTWGVQLSINLHHSASCCGHVM